jgi:hypothetical protein
VSPPSRRGGCEEGKSNKYKNKIKIKIKIRMEVGKEK